MDSLNSLAEKKLIFDTGERGGQTKSTKVFEVSYPKNGTAKAIPKTGHLSGEAIPKTDDKLSRFSHEAIPKTDSAIYMNHQEPPSNPSLTPFEFLKTKIAAFYERKTRWNHFEESTLAEIVRNRKDSAEEWLQLLAYHNALPPKDRRYFPRSIEALLQGWDKHVDTAGTQRRLSGSILMPKRTPQEQAALDAHNAQ